jgi:hypothetical protein
VRSVAGALEVHHAVEAGEGGAVALVTVGVELLLGEDIPTVLYRADVRKLRMVPSERHSARGRGAAQWGAASWSGRVIGGVNIPRRRTRPSWPAGECVSICKIAVYGWQVVSGQ